MVLVFSAPARESRSYNMRAKNRGLLFNELSPEDVDQMTIDDAPRLNDGAATEKRKEKPKAHAAS